MKNDFCKWCLALFLCFCCIFTNKGVTARAMESRREACRWEQAQEKETEEGDVGEAQMGGRFVTLYVNGKEDVVVDLVFVAGAVSVFLLLAVFRER